MKKKYCYWWSIVFLLLLLVDKQAVLYANDVFLASSYFSEVLKDKEEGRQKRSTTNISIEDSIQSYVVVNDISIKGNKRTKKHIILRELDFRIGDTVLVDNIEYLLSENRNQIYNTGLFNEVKIKVKGWKGEELKLLIEVEERWYIFPSVIFELTDPNFNVWWNTYNHDFSRTEYGVKFKHKNFRGRKEVLSATVQFGFTKKFELRYHIPYIDKKERIGISPVISYITNKRITYATVNHQPRDTSLFRKRFRVGTNLTLRQGIHASSIFSISFYNNSITNELATLNENYFLEGRTRQKYISLAYTYIRDYRDIREYPLTGNYFRLQMEKSGIGIFKDANIFTILANFSQYFKIAPKLYGLVNARTLLSLPGKQPFFNQRTLGGITYVRGYELYRIDAQNYGVARSALKFELLNAKFTNPLLKIPQFRTIPISIYPKIYVETGYARDKFATEINPLSNQWLLGAGVGIDIFTFYDNVFSLEYARNHQKEWGFYVSFTVNYDR